jgi:endonuclease/exonuclease/phosphatase family metal-dependent hydrolase
MKFPFSFFHPNCHQPRPQLAETLRMSRFWHILVFLSRTGIPLAMLGLHFFVFACFARRWDRAAAVTVSPIWAWAGAAILLCFISWLFHRGKGAFWVAVVWLATAAIMSEEPRLLCRIVKEKPELGPPANFQGKRVLRVANLNCKRNPAAAQEVAGWQPDIVMLQEAPAPHQMEALKKQLFPAGGQYIGAYDCAILTRGKVQVLQVQPTPGMPSVFFNPVLPAVVELDGRQIHLVCVHLQGAVTDLSLHKIETWEKHYYSRISRRYEIANVRNRLAFNRVISAGPVIMAGDFNAPSEDAVLRELRVDFTDAVEAVGVGFPNTFPNHFPVHRIDHIFSNGQCTPARAITVKTQNSDHRMIIADYLLN